MKGLLLIFAIMALVLANPTVTSDEKKNLRNSFSKATTDFYSWNIRKDLETFLLSKMKKGGATCAACDIFISTFVTYSNLHNLTASQFLWQNWCNMFEGAVQTGCNVLVQIIGPDVEQWMNEGQTPDQMCQSLGLCNKPECTMFPSDFVLKQELRLSSLQSEKMSFFSLKDLENGIKADWDKITQVNVSELEGSLNPFGWLKNLINNFASGHLPVLDLDKDHFGGDQAGFRGYNWRGQDCDDTNANIYPGRKNNAETPGTDYNCNGILGLDENGNDYKDKFCKNSGQIGVAVIGDSAGAHFQLPPHWMNASLMTSTTYHDLLSVLEDEADLPHMSAYTGYVQSTPDNLVNSIYQMFYERNKCNFRDYQNLAVNGGRSGNTINNMKALKRDPENDYPLLVFLELIGNDVCSSRPTGWTSLTDFKQNILTILNQLDETLPKGSHVFIYGLAKGTVLYEYMGSRTHPLGVTYDAVYDFLNCLEISPCAGWMNTNATIRQNTQDHADQLDQVYREIIAEGYKFKNFDYDYFDFAFEQLMKDYIAQGGQPWELIEPCDGFHPSQTANYYLANVTWQIIEQNHPDWLGKVNPFNDQIEEMFGNQGGY